MLPNWFVSHIICAGWPGEGDGACRGDSGGPLAQFKETPYPHFIQIGIFYPSYKNEFKHD